MVVLVGCSAPAPAPTSLTFISGAPGAATLAGGSYRVAWSAPGCTYLDVRWSPADGPETVIERTGFDGPAVGLPDGSSTVQLAAGAGYVNRSADCEATVTVTPAA